MPLPFRKLGRRKSQRLIQTIIVSAVGCFIIIIILLIQPFYKVNLLLSDQLFIPQTPSTNIVIVGIDDATLAKYGKWSDWPRSLHVGAIDNLTQAGAAVVGFDILFSDNSDSDQILAQSIAKAKNVILCTAGVNPVESSSNYVTFDHFLNPVQILNNSCLLTGYANVNPDSDGTVRRMSLLSKDSSGKIYPSFSLATLYALFSQPLPAEFSTSNGNLQIIDRSIPVDYLKRIRINFSNLQPGYTFISYAKVIDGDFDQSLIKHKIVLIGMTATGEPDTWMTPVSAVKLPGVYIHANVINTILQEKFLTESNWLVNLLIMLVIVGATTFFLPRMKLKWGAVLSFATMAGYAIIVFISFDRGYILNIFYPLTLLPIAFVTNVICTVTFEQSNKNLIKNLFGRYVSTQVASKILELDDAGKLNLGGELKFITVLFADIRGFTTFSEKLDPVEVVRILNAYLSIVINTVTDNEGIINKFSGDSIMAFWNAPQPQPEHPYLAVKAAWEAQQEINKKRENDTSLWPVKFGIGINTGTVIAGNVGSSGRAEYTVIGDPVNLASRICSITPGNEIWISSFVLEQVKEHVQVEEVGLKSFKGKEEPTMVFRVTGIK